MSSIALSAINDKDHKVIELLTLVYVLWLTGYNPQVQVKQWEAVIVKASKTPPHFFPFSDLSMF